MSSGEVSTRTRITGLPVAATASASSELNTISPDAAPGDAGRPVATIRRSAEGSIVGCRSWSSVIGSTRLTASSRLMRPSFAMSTAMRIDALAVRLPRPRLQHPQLPVLDGELHVLHVAVVPLEQRRRALELLEHRRQRRLHRRLLGARLDARGLGDVLRRADAGDDVLALRVDQELAVEQVLAGRRDCG